MFLYVCVFFLNFFGVSTLLCLYIYMCVQVLFTSIWNRVIGGGDIEDLLRWLMLMRVESKTHLDVICLQQQTQTQKIENTDKTF